MRGDARDALGGGLRVGDGANATRRRGVVTATGDAPTPLARRVPRSAPRPRGGSCVRADRHSSAAASSTDSRSENTGAIITHPTSECKNMRDSFTAAEAIPPAMAAWMAATEAVLSSDMACSEERGRLQYKNEASGCNLQCRSVAALLRGDAAELPRDAPRRRYARRAPCTAAPPLKRVGMRGSKRGATRRVLALQRRRGARAYAPVPMTTCTATTSGSDRRNTRQNRGTSSTGATTGIGNVPKAAPAARLRASSFGVASRCARGRAAGQRSAEPRPQTQPRCIAAMRQRCCGNRRARGRTGSTAATRRATLRRIPANEGGIATQTLFEKGAAVAEPYERAMQRSASPGRARRA